MKNIFHVILVAAPLAALILFFSLMNKEEVKNEQRVHEAAQTVQEQKFDNDFSDAWNGQPDSKTKKQRAEQIADLNKKVDEARLKRDGLDHMFDQAEQDMQGAIQDEDARLSGISAQVPNSKSKGATK